jgi:hypothetical protein
MSSSIEKNYCKKKKLLNSGNYLLSPLNENKNTRNNNSQNKNGIKIIINKLNTNQNIKNNNLNSQVINNISRSIKETKLKSKNILSKINKGDISSDVNNILSICINKNNSNISSAKSNKYENNSKTEELNINNSNIYNNNNDNYIKNYYINRNIVSSNSDSIKNNNIINNKQSPEYLKTDINEIGNTSNVSNIKFTLPNDKVNKHDDDIIGTPSGLFKKNNLSNYQFNTSGNILKNFYEKKTKKIFKLKNKDLERNISEVDYFNNNNKKGKCKCPEIMHFYYVYKFQEGKTNEIELEGE